jgi:Holliday junction DNA helicase RuvB
MTEKRFLTGEPKKRDVEHDAKLRPEDFSEYIGQKRVVENIDLMVKSALKRNAAMDHVLLSGPPGLGKTSLAMIIAKSIGSDLHVISGPAIEKKGDLIELLSVVYERSSMDLYDTDPIDFRC